MSSLFTGEPPSPARRRRRWRWVLLALVLVPIAVVVAVLVALRTSPVRRALLARAADAIERAAGGRLSADDLTLDPLTGTIRLRGVRYGVPGAPPFATAREATAVLALRTLTSGRPLVRSISILEPRIDLGAPMPKPKVPKEEKTSENPLGLPIEIAKAEVRGGVVLSGPTRGALAQRVSAWRIEGLDLTGRYRDGGGEVEVTSGTLAVVRPGRLELRLALAARARTEAKGTIALEQLSAKGDGVSLTASAETSVAKDAPLTARATLSGELAALAPELETKGSLTASVVVTGTVSAPAAALTLDARGLERKEGRLASLHVEATTTKERVDLARLDAAGADGGTLHASGSYVLASGATVAHVAADALPLDLATPFVPERRFRELGLAGTRLDGTIDAELPAGANGPAQARGDLTWSRGARALATLKLDGMREGEAIRAKLALALLPASAGMRRVSGNLVARSPKELARGRLEEGRVELELPDLAASLAELHELWPAFVPAPERFAAARGALTAHADVSGALDDPLVASHADWRPEPGASAILDATGHPARKDGKVALALTSIPLSVAHAGQPGRISGSVDLSGNPTSFTGHANVAARELGMQDVVGPSDEATLQATIAADAREVRVQSLRVDAGEKIVRVTGRAGRQDPWRDAQASIIATKPTPLLDELRVLLAAKDGVLDIIAPDVVMYGQMATLHAVAPLGTLARVPELAPKLTFLPSGLPTGAVTLEVHAPVLDSTALAREGEEPPKARATAGLDLALRVDPAAPASASGEATLSNLVIDTDVAKVRADGPIVLRLDGERLVLAPAKLVGDRTELALDAEALLALASLRGRAPASLVRSWRLGARGHTDASLLEPFLVGGIARGEAAVTADLRGTGEDLSGRVGLSAPGASFFWPTPYASKLESPELELALAKGAVTIERGTATLNGGNVMLSGTATTKGGVDVSAEFAGVRYVLAYGLRAELSGHLALRAPPQGARVLSGTVALERGLLERDVDLDREILTRFFAPPESEGTEASLLDTISLDLAVTTASGVRLANNLADLHATWSALEVRGTLRSPIIRGRIDVDRGGVVYAYGQRFTIERASLTYSGDPTTDPKIDAVTTSALQGGPKSPFATDAGAAPDLSALAAGIAGYYGERVASRLGAALGFHAVSRRADLIFSEADPGARLTLARDLSRNAAFTFSLDLTNPQNQTYIVDLHGIRRLPTMTLQVFKNDVENWGGTFQQSLQLGGARKRETGPIVQRITYTVPPAPAASSPKVPHVSARAIRAAVLLRKGDPLPKDATFDVEVEVERVLRDSGYPDARVTVTANDSKKKPGRIDLDVAIVPGDRAVFRFEGDAPPGASRRAIAALYRGDFYEAASLEEMRRRTERVFRALGHVTPKVTVTAARDGSERVVTVRSDAGPKLSIGTPAFVGVTADEAARLADRFPGPVERAELAAPSGTEAARDAERRLLAALSGLGYPRARVVSRALSGDGALTVTVEKDGASLVDSLEIAGVAESDRDALMSRVPLRAGDVARSDLIAKGTQAIEDEFLERGYDDVRVTTSVGPASPEDPPPLHVLYDVDPGVAYRLVAVSFQRGGSASRALLRRVAALRLGSTYRRGDVDDARARLLGVGIFDAVRAETVKRPDGTAEVVFSLQEAPRFDLAYGVRWESSVGPSGVVDIVDHDLFGRAITAGLRGVYEPKDERARLFLGASDLLGTRFALEAFVEVRRKTTPLEEGNDLRRDTMQATLQLSRPLGRYASARLYARYRRTRLLELNPDPFNPFPVDITIKYPFLGAEAVYDDRDDPFLATKGIFASIDVEATGAFLSSDFSYGRVYGQVNVYRPLLTIAGRRLTWGQSVRVGFAKAYAGQELLPDPNVRFFAGGEYSVRGYARDSLATVDPFTGEAIGGSTLLVVNEELRMPLVSRFTGVVFFDAGQVWESSRQFGTNLAKALGLGLRAATPVGLLRLDLARPLDRREGDKSYRLYFGFGTTF